MTRVCKKDIGESFVSFPHSNDVVISRWRPLVDVVYIVMTPGSVRGGKRLN